MGLFHVLSCFLPKTSIFFTECTRSTMHYIMHTELWWKWKFCSWKVSRIWAKLASHVFLLSSYVSHSCDLEFGQLFTSWFCWVPSMKSVFYGGLGRIFYGFFKCDHCGINFLQIVLHLTTSVNSFLVHRLFDHKSDLGKRRLPLEGPHPWQTEILTLPILTRYKFWQS